MQARPTNPAEFGSLLRRLRIAAELSQEDLAERARISVDAIGALERGRRKAPQRETVDLLLAALRPGVADRDALLAAANRARLRSDDAKAEAVPRHNLPMQLTSLIGRDNAIAEIQAQLTGARLMSIVGAGGVGKTRVALEAAVRELDRRPDGVWFVELAPVNAESLVAGTIAMAVGGAQHPNETAMQTLVRHLRNKETLLLLDNCEHVIDEVAQITKNLLETLPGLTVLATSRERLRIEGERVYPLAPLDDASAVTLFEQRARAADPGFRLTQRENATVVEICHCLDGLPLAIELAAARLRTLTPAQLAGRLDERLALLTNGDRTAAPRQQTMQALIDWSYDLLTANERRVLRKLAVFAGGFTLEGATAICEGDDVYTEVASLVDKSLLIVQRGADERRYTLLESVRAYALERLEEAGERVETARRHVEYIAKLTDSIHAHPRSVARRALAVEIENIRAAIAWVVTGADERDLGARILANASLLYTQRLYGEYVERATFFLAHADALDPAIQGRLWLGIARRAVGVPALEAAERAIELLEQAPCRDATLIHAHLKRAQGLAQQNRTAEALDANRGADLLREEICPNSIVLANIHHQRGFIFGQLHDQAASREEYERALMVYESHDDSDGAAYMRANIADACYRDGDIATAASLTRASLAVFRETHNWDGEAFALCNLAEFEIAAGNLAAAAQSVGEALDAAQRLASETWLATTAFEAAALAAHAGDARSAARLCGYVRAWREERAYHEAGDARMQASIEQILADGLGAQERRLLESAGAALDQETLADVISGIASSFGFGP